MSSELGSGEPRGSRVVLICMPVERASEGSDDRNSRAARDCVENGLNRVRTSVMNRVIMALALGGGGGFGTGVRDWSSGLEGDGVGCLAAIASAVAARETGFRYLSTYVMDMLVIGRGGQSFFPTSSSARLAGASCLAKLTGFTA